ncbi:MAG: AMP-binding protein [Betaproteobacteria bacterium]
MQANLSAALQASCQLYADRIALQIPAGECYTYAQVGKQVAHYAAVLNSAGAMKGDRIVVQVEKSPQSLFLYLACLRAGVVYVPLNTAYQPAELSYFLQDAEPALVVVGAEAEAPTLRLLASLNSSAQVLTLAAAGGSFGGEANLSRESVHIGSDDLAVIIYTSGTTGRSKGAMLTHRNLLSNARALIATWKVGVDDAIVHALPIFHVHGLFVANHCALLSGARLLWHTTFDVFAVMDDLPHATVMMGVPTFYTRLLAQSSFTKAHCKNIRLFISGSAPLLLETFAQFQARTGQTILERYGMSEAGMITSNPLQGERRGGTVGLPLPGVALRIADGSQRAIPNGTPGSIQIHGDNVFAGYWRNPEKTREEFTDDGWFRTGDIGVLDDDGYLSIVGRAKDLIITGGYNVYPKEIELVLDAIPGVRESAVVGVPHPDFGEAVTAVVVIDATGSALEEAGVITHLKGCLANYKVPKRVYFVAELPRNAMGKVQKNVVRQQVSQPAPTE